MFADALNVVRSSPQDGNLGIVRNDQPILVLSAYVDIAHAVLLSGVASPGPIRAQALVNYPCALIKLLVPEYERAGIAWERG